MAGSNATLDLFGERRLPEGMKYKENFLSGSEEQALLRDVQTLPFREFEFHGFTGKRRTVSFGWRYDFNGGCLTRTEDMPAFLTSLRERAETFAGVAASSFQQVLVTEYAPGAAIGWHKVGDVVGIAQGTFYTRRGHSPKVPAYQPAMLASRNVGLL